MNLRPFLFILLFVSSSAWAADIHLKISIQEGFEKLKAVQEVQDFVQQSLKIENIVVSFYPLPFARSSTLVNRGEMDGELMRAGNLVEDYQTSFFSLSRWSLSCTASFIRKAGNLTKKACKNTKVSFF